MVCEHTPAEVFVLQLEHLLDRTPQHLLDEETGIIAVTKSGNHYNKCYSFTITKPSHVEGCWI